jgi:hypothetical protein
MRWLLLFLGSWLAAQGSAQAIPILDAELVPDASLPPVNHDNDTNLAQFFRVGRSGLLTRIDVWFADAADTLPCCFLGVRRGSSVVGTSRVSGPLPDGPNSFLLDVPVVVSRGELLAFDIEHDGFFRLATARPRFELIWQCGDADGCVAPLGVPGVTPDVAPNTTFDLSAQVNLAFATWIEPLPEPGAGALLAAALACGLGRVAGRQNRTRRPGASPAPSRSRGPPPGAPLR